MYRGKWILMILFLGSYPAVSQNSITLSKLLGLYDNPSPTAIESYDKFVQDVKEVNPKNDRALLKKIFQRIHLDLLKTYKAYSEMGEIFTDGNFDCLTGTALMTVALSDFGFTYSVIETNYHIFIMVETSKGKVLLETTDRENGFVSNEKLIVARCERYKRNTIPTPAPQKNSYQYHFSLYGKIGPSRLPGLLYFNQAVKSYNSRQWKKCFEYIEKAYSIYESPRIAALACVLIQTVDLIDMDASEKKNIISGAGKYLLVRDVAGL